MKNILEKNIKTNIFRDEYEYFFTFLNDRFEYSVKLWKIELEKKFNKQFKPIWILSSKQNKYFKKENYIILNKKLKISMNKSKNKDLIHIEEYEELNKEFSKSKYISGLIEKLIKKQGRVFILGFTSSFLDINHQKAIILGPHPGLSTKLDNKVYHKNLFRKLNIPTTEFKIHNSINTIKKEYPLYISLSYSSGGKKSAIIYSEKELNKFYSKLSAKNKKESIIVSPLIKDIKYSPNITAFIDEKEKTSVICITDQILIKNQYLGNIFPSKANNKEKEQMINITKKIGKYMARLGYRGLFGLDFIIDSKNNILLVDLNPRRQGSYLTVILATMPKLNLVRQELNTALKEKTNINDINCDLNYSWAHSKIITEEKTKITSFVKTGDPYEPFNKTGTEYKAIFYPENHTVIKGNIGYIIISGHDYNVVKQKLIRKQKLYFQKI